MLAAALLSFTAPNRLEAALEKASEALRAEPILRIGYQFKYVPQEDEEGGQVDYFLWKENAFARYEISRDSAPMVKLVKNPPEVLAVAYLEKIYAVVEDRDMSQWRRAVPEGKLLPEPGNWLFMFTPEQKLVLRASPPLEVTEEKTEAWKGRTVEAIRFRSRRQATGEAVNGTARFDPSNHYLLGIDLKSTATPPGDYRVEKTSSDTETIDRSFYKIDLTGLDGFKKVSGPEIDL
ncbi:hypothetical protein EON81_21955 [bacterium]|nr:MAG: hypothetical protein EON81_21955 [bacterium]